MSAPLESPKLATFLQDIGGGKVQLPDFQRPWKWDDDRIRSLLATLTQNYPMGVVMSLETGGEGPRFKPRPLAGAELDGGADPDWLLLDGQQRMTSLYQALLSGKPVDTMDTRGRKLRRWYYIDIARAVDDGADREDAIVSVPEDRVVRQDFGRGVRHDLSTREKECELGFFPLQLAFDSRESLRWLREYEARNTSRLQIRENFQDVLDNITGYEVPGIRLTRETPKEAVCTVFEKVNTGGVPLNVFELLTATYAGDREYFDEHGEDFQLSDHWRQAKKELEESHPVLADLESTEFLQAVCLVASYERRQEQINEGRDPAKTSPVSCKRGDILNMPLASYLECAPRIIDGLRWVARFLARQGVFRSKDLPYRTQLVPLAAIRAVLGERADEADAEAKLGRWYWCGVLGEVYGGSAGNQLANDFEQAVAWVNGNPVPSMVQESTFQESRLHTLSTRNSAAYKGVYALLLKQGSVDWYYSKGPIDHQLVEDQQVGINHVFPQAWCRKNGVDEARRNSIVNKTPMSARARRTIGTRPPETYLRMLENETGLPAEWLDDTVATHLIEPEHLRATDFDAFYQARTQELLALVAAAMGTEVVRSSPESAEKPEDYEPAPDGLDGASNEG